MRRDRLGNTQFFKILYLLKLVGRVVSKTGQCDIENLILKNGVLAVSVLLTMTSIISIPSLVNIHPFHLPFVHIFFIIMLPM